MLCVCVVDVMDVVFYLYCEAWSCRCSSMGSVSVTPYRYLLPTMYLFMAGITNTDLFVCCCKTWICHYITRFKRSSPSHPAGPHGQLGQKNGKSCPKCWRREVSTQFARQFVTAVGCVVWRPQLLLFSSFIMSINVLLVSLVVWSRID